jgi:dethiobiotin synthetase
MDAAEQRPPGLFVTGTGTCVGKTLIAAALAHYLSGQGMKVGVMKPVETGVADPERLGNDGQLLCWASNSRAAVEEVSPYRLKAPLSPAQAAEQEGVRIEPSRLIALAHRMAEHYDFMIIEGAGGLMVPLRGGLLIADLVRELRYPLLIVSRPQLGTINHTLLTIFAARTMELPLAGFVINGMPANPDEAAADAPHALASLASADLLGVFNEVPATDPQLQVENLSGQIAALPTRSWMLRAIGL